MHDAASAYYKNLPAELQQKAKEKFNEMDSDGSKTISSEEFQRSMGISSEIKGCFELLDKNKDGKLNFNEFITLYYLVEGGRGVFCCGHGCKADPFLKGLYFTCVECFHNNEAATFDLCTSCYSDRKHNHEHANFLDNYVLLRSKAACESSKAIYGVEPNPGNSNRVIGRGIEMASDLLGQPELGTQLSPMSDQVGQPRSKRRALVGFFNSAKANVGLGDVSAESCSIM